MIQKRYALIAIIALGFVGIWTAVWWQMAGRLKASLDAAVQGLRAQGWVVETAPLAVGGWPFRLELHGGAVRVAAPVAQGGWSMAWKDLSLYWQPWNFRHVIVQARQGGEAAWPSAQGRVLIALQSDLTQASLILNDAMRPDRLSLVTKDATFTLDERAWRAEEIQFHIRRDPAKPDGPPQFNLQTRGLNLPEGANGLMGPTMARFEFMGRISGTVAPSPDWRQMIRAWQESGGVAELEGFWMQWGALDMRAQDVTFTFDKLTRPQFAMRAELRGYEAALDAMAAQKWIEAAERDKAKFALSLIAQTDAEGARVLPAPVTGQDGMLFIGPIVVGRLAPLLHAPQQ